MNKLIQILWQVASMTSSLKLENLSKKIQPVDSVLQSVDVEHHFLKSPITLSEVHSIINGLENKTSPGFKELTNVLVKAIALTTSPYTVEFINLSFKQGIFPTTLKCAKVIPLFKNGDKNRLQNYRPVS